ncbi:MAG: hypothetical protein ABW217_22295 [Polyangiaceae bacterium]
MTIRRSAFEHAHAILALVLYGAGTACSAKLEGAAPATHSIDSRPDAGGATALPTNDAAVLPASSLDAGRDAAGETTPAEARCSAPVAVSSNPRTIAEAVALMNALPRPTTLTCFIESLSGPLDVYFSKSQLSAQPADGEASPRTFIVNGSLFMSSVPSGFARNTLELGFRTSAERAIRAEIAFPLLAPVTPRTMAEHIEFGERATFCGFCHGREARASDPFLGELGFESDVILPNPDDELSIDAVRALAETCDTFGDDERCGRLRALFGHGALQRSSAFDESP